SKLPAFENDRGALVLGACEALPEVQWGLLAEMEVNEALAPLSRVRFFVLSAMLFVAAMTWMLGMLVSRVVANPIQRLYKGVETIGRGDLDHRILTGGGDEIGQISQAIDKMAANLKKMTVLRDKLATEIADRKRAEKELALKNEQLKDVNRRLAEQAQVDELTGLVNRRRFYEILSGEFERIRRYAGPLSMLMCDIDHFKQVNDTTGHAFGDLVLRRVASVLEKGCRKVDAVCRYGGDEFAVVMPGTTSDNAFRLAERLRKALGKTAVEDGEDRAKVTASFGIAGVEAGQATNPDDLVRLSDKALYAAKRGGRNRTINSRDVPAEKGQGYSDAIEEVLALQDQVSALSAQSQEALFESVLGLAQAQEARDKYLAGHSRNVAHLAVGIA
ncbi:MAG: diguanylate cyclase, partial [Phycisphaerae bacterium]|nr:diguanylate cyclase [Phycisphaerae bacterium]